MILYQIRNPIVSGLHRMDPFSEKIPLGQMFMDVFKLKVEQVGLP